MLSAVLVSGLGTFDGVPDGMQLMMLLYSDDDWDAVHFAYLQDQTLHVGAALCDIYKHVNDLVIPDLERKRIEPWMNNAFYAVCIGGDEKSFLVTDVLACSLMTALILADPRFWSLLSLQMS